MNTRTAKLKRYNIIHGHLDCLFYPMNDSVESDIEDTYKKKSHFFERELYDLCILQTEAK